MRKENSEWFSWTNVKKQLTIILAASMLCAIPISAFAQILRFSLKKNNVSISTILQQIEKESDYTFFYSDNQVKLDKQVSINVSDATIEKVLNEVFKNSGYTYKVEENQVIISTIGANKEVRSAQQQHQAKGQKISGVVKDVMGIPVVGASVIEKGTSNGTITDLDGNFTLTLTTGKDIQISYIGYVSQDVVIRKGVSSYTVTLKEDAKALDEVVVVGYGVQKKVNLTGSVAAVGGKDLETRVNTDVLQSVQGQIPGVTIISRPDGTNSINVRGRGNLGTSAPLYVIDGTIADATFFSSLDPNTIESISFLKDAASSAIYGSRAAYGVVLVKTKGGKEGDMKITYDGYVAMKQATYTPKILPSEWYARLSNEAAYNENPNGEAPYKDWEIEKLRDGSDPDMYPNTDWYDLCLDNTAFMTKHSVSFSGGNKVKYYTSLGYLYNDKFQPGAKTDRYNLLTNISADVKKWLTLRTNIKYIQDENNNENANISFMRLLTTPNIYVAQQSNGQWGSYSAGKQASSVDIQRNPYRNLMEGGWSNSTVRNTLIDMALDIKPMKGLVITGEMSYKVWDSKAKTFEAAFDKVLDFKTNNELANSNKNTNGNTESKMEYNWQESSRLAYNGLVNYTWSKHDHNINILAGISYEHYQLQKQKSYRKNFPTNGLTDINGGSSASSDMYTEGGSSEDKMMSYFGRINYSFKDRYLFEANMRADASSRFHPDNRWGIFPSFSAGWRINQEGFMQDIRWIDNLKIRASWGQLGNVNNVGYYDYFSSYIQDKDNNYNFEDKVVSSIIEAKPDNKTLGWETVTITDIGVDFDIFNGLLTFSGDYYNKDTKNILMSYNVPLETGIKDKYYPSQNIGRVRNRGLEFNLTHNKNFGDFSYSVGFNLTKNWNKVTDMGNSDNKIESTWIKKVGYAIGTFYGYKTDGLLTQEDIDNKNYIVPKGSSLLPNAGDVKYVDVHKDGYLDDNDRTTIGCDVPDITYGVNVDLKYKGFQLTVFGQGIHGTTVNFSAEQAFAFADYASPREYHLQRWTLENPNPNAGYPRIYTRTNAHTTYNQYFSDFWLFNSDYFRIKNITFGYSFNKTLLGKVGVDALKLYVSAENPFTVRGDHRMKDFDPETASGRGQNTRGTRSFAFGVNVTF